MSPHVMQLNCNNFEELFYENKENKILIITGENCKSCEMFWQNIIDAAEYFYLEYKILTNEAEMNENIYEKEAFYN